MKEWNAILTPEPDSIDVGHVGALEDSRLDIMSRTGPGGRKGVPGFFGVGRQSYPKQSKYVSIDAANTTTLQTSLNATFYHDTELIMRFPLDNSGLNSNRMSQPEAAPMPPASKRPENMPRRNERLSQIGMKTRDSIIARNAKGRFSLERPSIVQRVFLGHKKRMSTSTSQEDEQERSLTSLHHRGSVRVQDRKSAGFRDGRRVTHSRIQSEGPDARSKLQSREWTGRLASSREGSTAKTPQNLRRMALQNSNPYFVQLLHFREDLCRGIAKKSLEDIQMAIRSTLAMACFLKEEQLLLCCVLLYGELYLAFGFLDQAFFFFNEHRILCNILGEYRQKADGFLAMSEVCIKIFQIETALVFVKKALEVYYVYSDTEGELNCYDRIGKLYFHLGNLKLANNYHERALDGILEQKLLSIARERAQANHDAFVTKYKMNSVGINLNAFEIATSVVQHRTDVRNDFTPIQGIPCDLAFIKDRLAHLLQSDEFQYSMVSPRHIDQDVEERNQKMREAKKMMSRYVGKLASKKKEQMRSPLCEGNLTSAQREERSLMLKSIQESPMPISLSLRIENRLKVKPNLELLNSPQKVLQDLRLVREKNEKTITGHMSHSRDYNHYPPKDMKNFAKLLQIYENVIKAMQSKYLTKEAEESVFGSM